MRSIVIVLFSIFCINCTAGEIPKNDKNLLEIEVSNLVNLISHGNGKFNPSEMVIQFIEIDKRKYAIVFFNFDFGFLDVNAHFLSLFEYEADLPKKYALTAFRDTNVDYRRVGTFKYLGGNKIEVSGLHYIKDDSPCCPSGNAVVIYSVLPEDFKEESVKYTSRENELK